jgi:RHS repeat-associated protein
MNDLTHQSNSLAVFRSAFGHLLGIVMMLFVLTNSINGQTATDGRTPLGIAPGSPAGSYALSGLDNVNLYNGNLDFQLPLLGISGRGEAQMNLLLSLNLKGWRVLHTNPSGIHDNYKPIAATAWWSGNIAGGSYGPGKLEGRQSGTGFTDCSSYPGGNTNAFGATITRLTFLEPDGSEHELIDQLTGGQPLGSYPNLCSSVTGASRGTVFISHQGEAITFISDPDKIIYDRNTPGGSTLYPSGYLMLRNGTRYRVDNGTVTWLRDRNGNKMTFTYDTSLNVTVLTDSLNRQVTIAYNFADVAPYGVCDRITFKGFGGEQRIIRVSKTSLSSVLRQASSYSNHPAAYTLQTYQQLFPELNAFPSGNYNPGGIVSAVWLPDGARHYQLYYDSYGELVRVELPTGGAVEYDMTPGSGVIEGDTLYDDSYLQIYRRLVERRVYSDGVSLEGKQTYSATYSSSQDPTPWSTTVTVDHVNPGGTLLAREKHYFYGSGAASLFRQSDPTNQHLYSGFKEGKETQTEAIDTDGVTVLRRVVNNWAQRALVSWGNWALDNPDAPANDPRLTDTTTTLTDVSPNLVALQTFGYDDSVPYNNQNNVKEYDFGSGVPGALVRETHTTFVTDASYTGTTVHVRNLPTQVSVYDGTGVERARTTFEYDNYTPEQGNFHAALVPRSTISGLCDGTQNNCPNGPNFSDPLYLQRGNATRVTRWLLPATEIKSYSQYDVAGNVVKTIDPNGNTTNIDYSDRFGTPNGEAELNPGPSNLGSELSYAFPTKITNALGHITYTQFDYYLGRPVDGEDANGVVSSGSYNDVLDRPKQVIRASNQGASVKSQTSFSYDDLNRTITTTSDLNSFNDPNPLKSETVYDGLGRTIEARQYETNSAFIAVKTNYDALGRAFQTSNPYRSGETLLWTTSGFDALGRVISVTTPDTAVVNTYYRGSQVLVKEQTGKERMSQTNALGQLTDVWEITGSDDSTESVSFPNHAEVVAGYRTKYTYHPLGNLTTVTQQKGTTGTTQTRNFVYNSLSQLTDATNPESGHIVYDYDANGNLLHKTDARPVTTTYAYDALNRNMTIDYSDTAGINPDITRAYDGATNGKGRLWESYAGGSATVGSNVEHSKVTAYDALGRPLNQLQEFKTNGVWSSSYTMQRAYNLAGGATSQIYPSGHTVAYAYDTAGRANSFTGNLGDGDPTGRTYSSEIIYSPLGGITKEKFGTDTALYNKLFYNSRGQLAEIRVGTYNGTDGTWWNRGAIINHYSNGCWGMCGGSNSTTSMTDNNGNLKKQEVYVPANDQITSYTTWWQGYDYDNLNRLQRVHEYTGNTPVDWQQEYVYDRYGNRTIHQTNTWGAGINKKDFTPNVGNSNRLGVPAGQTGTMAYDNAGNLTTDSYSQATYAGSGSRVYDAENRMTSAQDANGVWSYYTYNADGQRVRRKVNGLETWQVYGFGGELLAEYAANAAPASPQKEYCYRNGQLLITADVTTGPPVPTFSDDFNDNSLDTGKWSVVAPTSPAVVSETGQRLQITLPPNTATYNGISSNSTFDLTGKSVQVEVAQTVSQAGWCENFIQVVLDANNYYLIDVGAGSMVFRSMTGGVNNQAVISYDPSALPYWRIRHDQAANTINLETSNNGTSWTTRKTVTPGFSLTALRFYLYAGAWGTGNGSPGAAKYDNFQLVGNTPSTVVNLNWLVSDQLGTPRMVFDKTGALATVKRHDYLPFGEELTTNQGLRTATLGYGAADGVRQKFTSKERDIETGLDFFGARYYASTQGRFTSADSILIATQKVLDPQQWNMYSYTRNNPVRFTDPTGRYVCSDGKRCEQFEKARQEALKSKDSEALRAARAYGDPSKKQGDKGDNGVYVGFADNLKGDRAGTVERRGTGIELDSNSPNGLRATVNVTIKSDQAGNEEVIAHEGSHVADKQEFVNAIGADGNMDKANPLNITLRQSEIRAYKLSISYAQRGNQTLNFGPCGMTKECKFPPSMMPALRDQQIDDLLRSQYKNLDTVIYPELKQP